MKAHIIFAEGPYRDRVFKLKDPTQLPPQTIRITDGGNTIEDEAGYIIGHFVGMYDPDQDGPLPDPNTLPPC